MNCPLCDAEQEPPFAAVVTVAWASDDSVSFGVCNDCAEKIAQRSLHKLRGGLVTILDTIEKEATP